MAVHSSLTRGKYIVQTNTTPAPLLLCFGFSNTCTEVQCGEQIDSAQLGYKVVTEYVINFL